MRDPAPFIPETYGADVIFRESYEEAKRIVMEELGPGGAEWIPAE